MGATRREPGISKWGPAETPALCAQPLRCVLCGSRLRVVLDLGEQPLANGLLEQPDDPCARYPLRLAHCTGCRQVQLADGVPPEALFGRYVYRTGASAAMVRHFHALAEALAGELPMGARVYDVGSNDGTLLGALRERGLTGWGVDPSDAAAGVPFTHSRYFTRQTARELREEDGAADAVVIANCLAHGPDPAGMLAGAADLLKLGGRLVIEAPYVRELVAQLAYPTIYHEHLSYLSASTLQAMLTPVGFAVERVERLSVHHGSLRVWARRVANPQRAAVAAEWLALLREEAETPIDWEGFAGRVAAHRYALREACSGARRLAGYGCPAKATVLLNYCELHLDLISDTTPEKQGRYLPGLGTPIVPVCDLRDYDPDRVVLLAANFAEEIREQEPGLAGRWVVPLAGVTRA